MRILITSIVDLRRVTHNRIHVFVDHLSRRHDVTVLCLNAWWLEDGRPGSCGPEYHSDPYFQEMFERTRILYLSRGRVPPVVQEFTSLRTLQPLLAEVDYATCDVHVNYSNLIAGYFVARKARRLGIPTVFDIADDLPRRMATSPQVPRLARGPARLVTDIMLRANVKVASKVTYVTQALGDAYRIPDDRGSRIPNGVHSGMLAKQPVSSLRKRLGWEQDFVLGFVGVLLPRVDVELMLVALKKLRDNPQDVKMLVVGGGERLQQARDLAGSLGVSDRVLFTGFVPLAQTWQYIACMDVCLIPISVSPDCQHAFPVKLVEYMACEKPVVSVPLAGVREAVGDRVLYARDSDELADRIRLLYSDAPLRRRMGVEGSKFVRENYDWQRLSLSFEHVLAEAASESAAASGA